LLLLAMVPALLASTTVGLTLQGSVADPRADPRAIVLSGCARFTVLTTRLVRAELPAGGRGGAAFDDRATFAVVNRKLPVPHFNVTTHGATTVITTAHCQLVHAAPATGACSTQFASGELVLTVLGPPGTRWVSEPSRYTPDAKPSSTARVVPEPLNLNGTMNHGPSFAGGLDCYSNPPACAAQYRQVIGQGLLSRAGYAIVNETNSTRMSGQGAAPSRFPWFDGPSTREANHVDSEDLYLLVSGTSYRAALKDFASVGGAPALPPLSALGVWYSRYYPYGEASYRAEIIDKYKANALPLSVGVLDVPWHNVNYNTSDLGPDKNGTAPPGHGCNGWDGFTFNRTLFPDPKRFFDGVHAEGIKMALSVHMQNGIDHCQGQYRAMAEHMGYSREQIAAGETVNCTMDTPAYVDAFFETILDARPVASTGDYWWLDYPGGASNFSGWDQQEMASLWWSNHVFADHARS